MSACSRGWKSKSRKVAVPARTLARAVQAIWPDVKVTIGPVRDHGWFYDFDRAEPFTPEDLGQIEAKMRQIIAARDPVRTEIWDRARARAHYEAAGEPFKVELVDRIPEGQPIRMYWHGDWQDLCRGPHLQNTGQLPADAFELDFCRCLSRAMAGDLPAALVCLRQELENFPENDRARGIYAGLLGHYPA